MAHDAEAEAMALTSNKSMVNASLFGCDPDNYTANGTCLKCLTNFYLENTTCIEMDMAMIHFEYVLSIVVPVIFGVIVVCGLIGNMLVIIVVLENKQMRNTTNLLIINLALADLVFIIICVPFTAFVYASPNWSLGLVWCKIYQYVINVTAYASVYTLVLMSLDRYLAVVHPITSMTIRTEQNAYIVIGISWLLICGLNIPVYLDHGVFVFPRYGMNRKTCVNLKIVASAITRDSAYEGQVFYGCFFAFAYVIPLMLVCVLYGLMLKRLLYGVVPGRNQSAESMRSKRRVTRMVIIVVVIFAICWMPVNIRFLIQYFGSYPDTEEFVILQIIFNCFAYMNSCVNPFLYAFLSDNFRKSFIRLLCCKKQYQGTKLELEKTTAKGLEPISRTYTSTATNTNNAENGV